MTTGTIVLIVVVAVAALLLIGGLVWVARNKRNQRRHVEAGKIREAAREEILQVRQREALADETAAKARAAHAEADVKAAQAAGLQQQAAAHRSEAATSRDQLNEQWDRANKMDPASQTPDTPESADRREPRTDDGPIRSPHLASGHPMTQEAIDMTASSCHAGCSPAGWLVPVVYGLVVLDGSAPH